MKNLINIYIAILLSYNRTILSYLRTRLYIVTLLKKVIHATPNKLVVLSYAFHVAIAYITSNRYIMFVINILLYALKLLAYIRKMFVLSVIGYNIVGLLVILLFGNDFGLTARITLYPEFQGNFVIFCLLFLLAFIYINELPWYNLSNYVKPCLNILATIITYSTIRNFIVTLEYFQNTLFIIL